MKKHLLLIDDEEAVCWTLERAFTREGYSVAVAPSAEVGLAQAEKHRPDVIILDIRLPGLDGLSALPRLRGITGDVPVIVITAFGTLPTAVRALEAGAFEYLPKPFDLASALDAVRRALLRSAQESAQGAKAESTEQQLSEEIIGRGPAMQGVFKRIALVASRDSPVLITGESGTGKELVARALHRYSLRKDQPFLPVHLAALNPNLIESELFGHARGAFTGANQARPGLLTLADGGTVFLDELGEVPLQVQVKLLRVLENNEVLPVGGDLPQPLNLRILAATHQDLNRAVAEGRFRHDLYFRLNVFEIRLPTLRERPEDIGALAEHFLRRFEPRALPLTEQTLRYLQELPWYGNVRELRNVLEHAAIIARGGPLLPEHFPPSREDTNLVPEMTAADQIAEGVRRWLTETTRNGEPSGLYAELLRLIEPALLGEVIRRVEGNRWVAAQWLGLNRATVRKKLALYGLGGAEVRPEGTET